MSDNNTANRNKLYGSSKQENPNKTVVERENNMKKKLDGQNEKLTNALGLLDESIMVAEQTNEELKKNTESIKRSTELASNVSDETKKANQSLGNIERRRKYFGIFDIFNSKKK